ncbi:MAG: RluA family pseudouridine synthase [Lachnospiraceae bacterium]|nr:RluA family pseudouridine synthase [Lachnospiraceae bacterium]
MKEFVIRAEESSQRLDKYLRRLLPQAAGGFLYKMLRKKNITLNGSRATGKELLAKGDAVRIYFSDDTFEKFAGHTDSDAEYEALKRIAPDITVVFEDADIIVLSKPAGILTQKAKDTDISLNEQMLSYLIHSGALNKEQFAAFRPSVMNRLDFGTSGIVLAAKSLQGARSLAGQIASHSLKKEYLCLVHGDFRDQGKAVSYLVKDETANLVSLYDEPTEGAVRIETDFSVEQRILPFTLVRAGLVTGKSHQIRSQLAKLGHPIVFDAKYGNRQSDAPLRKRFPYLGQLLHAHRVVLEDGREFAAEMPGIFSSVMSAS